MNIFKKFFGGEKESDQSNESENMPGFAHVQKSPWQSFDELLEQHAGLSFEKQLILGDLIGTEGWQFDMATGSISFGENLVIPVQIIGSLSFNDNSWMWGWANTESGIPENLLKQSYQLKQLGEEKGIKEFQEGHLSVEEGFEHKLGMVACGLFESKSYYSANYGEGTLIVTLESAEIPAVNKNRLEKVLTSFPQLTANIVLNHREAFKNYLIDRDFQLKLEDDSIEGVKNGKIIRGEFDELARLTNLSGKI